MPRRRAGQQHGDRDGAQRRRLRHPPERHGRRLVHRARRRWSTACSSPATATADAAPDLGDSAITETAGVGGFAMAAAPAIVQFVGGTPQDAIANTDEMTPHHARPQRRVHPAGARLRRHARGHRRAQGGRHRHRADHQHRHRPPRGGRSARSAPASPARRWPASPRRSSRSPSGSRAEPCREAERWRQRAPRSSRSAATR